MFNLKQRREALKISQDEVAEATGVSRGTVSKWESGDIANMKRDKIASLSKLLRVSPLEILGIEEPQKTEPADSHNYPYMPADIAAGVPTTVDAITRDDFESIAIPDAVMGRWAGNKEICLMHINGESMNRIIPNGSMIGVQRLNDVRELRNGDIVVFNKDGEYSVKRFFNDQQSKTFSFNPDSTNSDFHPIIYRYEDAESLEIVGKVAVYIVTMD